MARQLRIEYKGAFYHVTSRGNERKKIYFSKYDYNKFKEYLGEAQDKYGYQLHCYVLMSNHYHLVIETPNGNISKIMHYINGALQLEFTFFEGKKSIIGFYVAGVSFLYLAFFGKKVRYRA